MLNTRCGLSIACCLLSCGAGTAHGQLEDNTVGVLVHEAGTQPGYTLIDGLRTADIYLIDNDGRIVNQWNSSHPAGNMVYILEDGSLLRASDPGPMNGTQIAQPGDGGLVERFDWDGEVIWSFIYNDAEARQHHDIQPMPNGNVLILAWEYHTLEEAIEMGRDPATIDPGVDHLLAERIVEVQPTGPTSGEVVWSWSSWDHHVQDHDPSKPDYGAPADHPGRIDFNYLQTNRPDWLHANSIDYHPELDQILISIPRFREIWIIDHDLSTAEAATEAGDLIYRWGNPQAHARGGPEDQILWGQHDALWIPEGRPGAGNITVYNNGNDRPEGTYSTVEEITPPLLEDGTYELIGVDPYGPPKTDTCFIYDPPTDFFSSFISGATRMPNGNTLACAGGRGYVVEMTPDGDVVWEYRSPVTPAGRLMQGELPQQGAFSSSNQMFRCPRYPDTHAGFIGKDLTPGAYLELYPECAGDLDGNRIVDGADLTVFLGNWGLCTEDPCLGDLNEDGIIDGADLTAILGSWGLCP